MAGEDVVYVVRGLGRTSQMPGDAAMSGRVLFTDEPVPVDMINAGLDRCLRVAQTVMSKAAALGSGYQVESITLKLALDAKVGVAFVGDASVEAAIEVEITKA